MATVKVGDKLKDNDRRNAGRVVEVIAVTTEAPGLGRLNEPPKYSVYAYYKSGHRKAKIRTDRIYSDQKPRSKGWNLLPRPGISTEPGSVNVDQDGKPAHYS